MNNTIAISMDIDWAPDPVIEDSLRLLASYDVQATLFMTHQTSVDISKHELGIHPNFTSLDLEKHLQERLNDFPHSKGVRSHSFFFTERLRPLYARYGILYQSNVMMYRQPYIKPYLIARSTLEIPLFWMDFFYIEMEHPNLSFQLTELEVETPGLKVFDFHPIHVFLNTESLERYETAKDYYHEPKKLLQFRNNQTLGTRDLLIELLEHIQANNIQPKTLQQIIVECGVIM